MNLLNVRNLSVSFNTADGVVRAVTDLSFTVAAGETLGIVGESGSGKSQTAMAILRLLARNALVDGEVFFDGQDLLRLSTSDMLKVRGQRIGMIFQDPMTALNPHLRIGTQLAEVLVSHRGLSWQQAMAESARMMQAVHLPDATARLQHYPHELSGGQRQRVMIAMALLCRPQLLIADEPTTALDVTVQAQILRLLVELRREFGLSLILITHDLGVMAEVCDRSLVMYGGRAMEQGPCRTLLTDPVHPYTRALIASRPRLDMDVERDLPVIAGAPPSPIERIFGCPFAPRCELAFDRCNRQMPDLEMSAGRECACHAVSLCKK
ncbi:MAG: ABC transporter ATP-binding protein [Pseudomonadota bacterium]